MTLFADLNPNVPIPFSRIRQFLEDTGLQEGVAGTGDFKVAQRGAGANMSVDIPAGQAWVEIDTGTRNGLGHVVNDATANVAVTAAHATLPRVDYAVLQWNESSIPTGSGDVPTLVVLAGTPTTGAQATNPTAANYLAGAPTLGNDRLLLAAFTVGAAATTITTANILDRRKWARGAFGRQVKTNNATNATTTLGAVDAGTLQQRIECSGVPVRVTLRALGSNGTAGSGIVTGLFVDGANVDGFSNLGQGISPAASQAFEVGYAYTIAAPTAGSHLFTPVFAAVTSGTATITSAGIAPILFVVEELVRPNTNNGVA